jgi:hypothetical protein
MLPFVLRKALTELLFVFTEPIRMLYVRFMDFRNTQLSKLSYNSQYPNLQRLLNDKFDQIKRRIYVYDNILSTAPTIAYPSGTYGKTQLVTTFVITSYQNWGKKPFIVSLPSSIFDDKIKKQGIIRLVELYKFAGTKYQLINQN